MEKIVITDGSTNCPWCKKNSGCNCIYIMLIERFEQFIKKFDELNIQPTSKINVPFYIDLHKLGNDRSFHHDNCHIRTSIQLTFNVGNFDIYEVNVMNRTGSHYMGWEIQCYECKYVRKIFIDMNSRKDPE